MKRVICIVMLLAAFLSGICGCVDVRDEQSDDPQVEVGTEDTGIRVN